MTAQRTPREDLKLIESFTSGDPARGQLARAKEWWGWQPSTATRCPRAVAGKRCQFAGRGDDECVCQRRRYPLLGHPRMWVAEGKLIFTAEPYGFEGDNLAGLVTECAQLGLTVSVHGMSPYSPGRAVLIIIHEDFAARARALAAGIEQEGGPPLPCDEPPF